MIRRFRYLPLPSSSNKRTAPTNSVTSMLFRISIFCASSSHLLSQSRMHFPWNVASSRCKRLCSNRADRLGASFNSYPTLIASSTVLELLFAMIYIRIYIVYMYHTKTVRNVINFDVFHYILQGLIAINKAVPHKKLNLCIVCIPDIPTLQSSAK